MNSAIAEKVWLLAASTGGLKAVRDFLFLVPKDVNVALVYVQHINMQQLYPLVRMVEKQAGWQADVGDNGNKLEYGKVTVISPQFETRVSKDGNMLRFTSPWDGVYSPSIDQVAKRIALLYGELSGAIIFTGMGNDGVKGCKAIKKAGGQVWVQDPSTCTVTAMPEAVIAAGYADYVGSVNLLADRFKRQFIAQ